MEDKLRKEYQEAIEFLEIRRRGEDGSIMPGELDEHIEKNAGKYQYWAATLADTEGSLEAVKDQFEMWLLKKMYVVKDAMRKELGKSANITKDDVLGKILNEGDVEYSDYKERLRSLKNTVDVLKTVVEAYDKRGFHTMNLANRSQRGMYMPDTSKGDRTDPFKK